MCVLVYVYTHAYVHSGTDSLCVICLYIYRKKVKKGSGRVVAVSIKHLESWRKQTNRENVQKAKEPNLSAIRLIQNLEIE